MCQSAQTCLSEEPLLVSPPNNGCATANSIQNLYPAGKRLVLSQMSINSGLQHQHKCTKEQHIAEGH
jgi:hypothetical protein